MNPLIMNTNLVIFLKIFFQLYLMMMKKVSLTTQAFGTEILIMVSP